jgi:DNA (cytosine-5)-methyltransferase 1
MSVGAPTFLSVFSGVGGFDLGLERSGWRCAGQIEVDPFCTRVLARHWPDVPRWGDVRTVNADTMGSPDAAWTRRVWSGIGATGSHAGQHDGGPVDLLCGGFPCQDLSVAGRRAGLSAARSGLFFEFVRLAGELRPRWILLENVPGLFSSNGGRDFALILHTLDQLGYGVSWRVLDSRYFGVPQRRRRVFLVGHLGAACPIEILFESEGGERDTAPGGEAGADVAGTIGGGSGKRGWCSDIERMTFVASVAGTPTCPPPKGGYHGDAETETFVVAQNSSDVQVGHGLGALTSGQASHGALPMVSQPNTPKGDSGVSRTLVRRLTPL